MFVWVYYNAEYRNRYGFALATYRCTYFCAVSSLEITHILVEVIINVHAQKILQFGVH